MALRDEIKAGRRDLMENGTFKEKIKYFFDYYTIHTVVTILAVILISISVYQQVTKREPVLSGILLNVISVDSESDPLDEMNHGFMKYMKKDSKKYELSMNSSLFYQEGTEVNTKDSNRQVSDAITVQVAAKSIDFIMAPSGIAQNRGYDEIFANLEDVLSKDELAAYEPYLIYVEREEAKEPVPVFIDVSECKDVANIYSYSSEAIVMGVAVNAPNADTVSDYLAYLYQ